MKAKKLCALLLALMMLFALAACNNEEQPDNTQTPDNSQTPDDSAPQDNNTPSELVFGQFNMKAPLDRTVGTYIETSQVVDWIYEGLYAINPETGELEPRLAESYEVSDDGLTYTFHLRKGVKFHNGQIGRAHV